MLDSFAFYIRDDEKLYPINVDSMIEFDFYQISLKHKSSLIKSNSRITEIISDCSKNYSVDELEHAGFEYNHNKNMENIVYYNFGIYGFGTIGTTKINLYMVDESILEINFDKKFCTSNKEIVLVCFGCSSLLYLDGMLAKIF